MSDHIATGPIVDGIEWFTVTLRDSRTEEYCQCARCGSSCVRIDCDSCGGEGFVDIEDSEDELEFVCDVPCDDCDGIGGSWHCCSGREWCEAFPMPEREAIESTALARDDREGV